MDSDTYRAAAKEYKDAQDEYKLALSKHKHKREELEAKKRKYEALKKLLQQLKIEEDKGFDFVKDNKDKLGLSDADVTANEDDRRNEQSFPPNEERHGSAQVLKTARERKVGGPGALSQARTQRKALVRGLVALVMVPSALVTTSVTVHIGFARSGSLPRLMGGEIEWRKLAVRVVPLVRARQERIRRPLSPVLPRRHRGPAPARFG